MTTYIKKTLSKGRSARRGLLAVLAVLAFAAGVIGAQQPVSAATAQMQFFGTGYCIDVDHIHGPVGDGTAVQSWQCNGGASQKWTDTNYSSASFSLRNPESGKCLDVDQLHGTVGAKTRLQVWSCNYGFAQRWTKDRYSSGGHTYLSYRNPSSGLCVDVPYSAFNNGNQLWVYYCNHTNAQDITGPGN